MSDGAPDPGRDERGVGELVFDVSERVSLLVREEIELAKAEITEKLRTLLTGSVVGIVAGVFLVAALAMFMHGFAWLLNDLFFEDTVWLGFMVEAALFILIAAGAGYFAYRAVRKGAPPVPEMAIEEGRRIKQTLEAGTTPAAREP